MDGLRLVDFKNKWSHNYYVVHFQLKLKYTLSTKLYYEFIRIYHCVAWTISKAFFLASSNLAFASSAPNVDNLASSRSFLTDIYAAEACSGVSNVPTWRVLWPHHISDLNFSYGSFRTPRGRLRFSGTNPPNDSRAFFLATSTKSFNSLVPHDDFGVVDIFPHRHIRGRGLLGSIKCTNSTAGLVAPPYR